MMLTYPIRPFYLLQPASHSFLPESEAIYAHMVVKEHGFQYNKVVTNSLDF